MLSDLKLQKVCREAELHSIWRRGTLGERMCPVVLVTTVPHSPYFFSAFSICMGFTFLLWPVLSMEASRGRELFQM
jgi:hypothetical protein